MLSLPLREGGPLAVDECYTPEVYFLPLGKLLLSGHFYHSSVILEQVLECHLSRCGSVTLEGKQHSVVFLHSRAAALPQGKAWGECGCNSRFSLRYKRGLLPSFATQNPPPSRREAKSAPLRYLS